MSCHTIRAHIAKLPMQQIFCTREFLHLSTRANVDQTLFRMARGGLIQRLARGVFVRDITFKTTPIVIATAKALAFGKRVVLHPVELLSQMGLAELHANATFAIQGRRTAIHLEPTTNEERVLIALGLASKKKVSLSENCMRKLFLADSNVGEIMRSIWHMKKENCCVEKVEILTKLMGREEHVNYDSVARFLPAWLTDYVYLVRSGRIYERDQAAAYWSQFSCAA